MFLGLVLGISASLFAGWIMATLRSNDSAGLTVMYIALCIAYAVGDSFQGAIMA